MEKIENFFSAWRFLEEHKMFQDEGRSIFVKCLDIEVRQFHREVSGAGAQFPIVEIFLKCGVWYRSTDTGLGEPLMVRAPELDSSALTFEEAIIGLANLVLGRFGK